MNNTEDKHKELATTLNELLQQVSKMATGSFTDKETALNEAKVIADKLDVLAEIIEDVSIRNKWKEQISDIKNIIFGQLKK